MKLKFVCFEVSGNGGVETVLTKVVNHLAKNNNITLILSNDPENKSWLENMDNRVEIIVNAKTSKVANYIFLSKIFLKAKNDDRFIILGANIIKMAASIRKLLRSKWTITSWIHFSLTGQSMFNPANIKFADNHWAISSKIMNQLSDLGIDKSNIELIYNPISQYTGMLNRPNESETVKLVFVGHIMLNGQKNLKELFDGIRIYKGEIHVDLYGSADELIECQTYAKKIGIDSCLSWHSWMQDPWTNIMETVHPNALVMTSQFEGLPMVMLEAESRGIPCISSQFVGYDDIIVDGLNGFSYPLGDTEKLAELFDKLLRTKFDVQKVTGSISNFYDTKYFERLDQALSRNKLMNKLH